MNNALTVKIDLFDLIFGFAKAIDLINPLLDKHHYRVTYLSLRIAEELKLDSDTRQRIFLAGMLHDIGAISFPPSLSSLKFTDFEPQNHAYIGEILISIFEPFKEIAKIVKYHHAAYNSEDITVPLESRIICLADRIVVAIDDQSEILKQRDGILDYVKEFSGKLFDPVLVELFTKISYKEFIWFELIENDISEILKEKVFEFKVENTFSLSTNQLLGLTEMISLVIDFRSSFTATHSAGVSAVSEIIGLFTGLSLKGCLTLKIAGFLHDIGKLAVPNEILEKNDKLTKHEFNIVKRHTFYTYSILNRMGFPLSITEAAAFHHEKLDGTGYPFKKKGESISKLARILAIADLFVALTEDRPYRKGMKVTKAVAIMKDMASRSFIDAEILEILNDKMSYINEVRDYNQRRIQKKYSEYTTGKNKIEGENGTSL